MHLGLEIKPNGVLPNLVAIGDDGAWGYLQREGTVRHQKTIQ
jgi:hypothetical protein